MFIHLNRTAECPLFVEQCADLLEHAPSRFVGNASLALDLLYGDPAARRGHEVDGMEPSLERRAGLVEDRSGGRVDVMAALIARVRPAAHRAVMLGHALAKLAKDAIWVQIISEPFEARSVVREHIFEVFVRKPLHLRLLRFHVGMLSNP